MGSSLPERGSLATRSISLAGRAFGEVFGTVSIQLGSLSEGLPSAGLKRSRQGRERSSRACLRSIHGKVSATVSGGIPRGTSEPSRDGLREVSRQPVMKGIFASILVLTVCHANEVEDFRHVSERVSWGGRGEVSFSSSQSILDCIVDICFRLRWGAMGRFRLQQVSLMHSGHLFSRSGRTLGRFFTADDHALHQEDSAGCGEENGEDVAPATPI